MHPESGFRIAPNRPEIGKRAITSQFVDKVSSSKFFDIVLFLLSSLVTGPSFMSISSLFLELWQFSFIRDWPEIRKSGITPSKFCPVSGDWGELGIPNLAQLSLMKCYWMLRNVRVPPFTVSELLSENQQEGGGGVKFTPFPHIKIRVKALKYKSCLSFRSCQKKLVEFTDSIYTIYWPTNIAIKAAICWKKSYYIC